MVSQAFTDLAQPSSHPYAILRGQAFSVFAKLGHVADAHDQFAVKLAELAEPGPAKPARLSQVF